jgi:ribulose-phosphate 3-epimerase
MIEIIPAIMPDSADDLREKAKRVKDHVPLAQIDIMDGTYVRSKSWPYIQGGPDKDEYFSALKAQDEGLPFWDTLDYELDLMIQAPEKHLNDWLPLGASRLIFHIESILDKDAFFRGDLFEGDARRIGDDVVIEIGLAIDPNTSIEEILPHVPKVDFIQCMGIAKIGYQGQPFAEGVLMHIERLRREFPDLTMSVDGAVNRDTAGVLKEAGVTRLVSGSAIFQSQDMGKAIAGLRDA